MKKLKPFQDFLIQKKPDFLFDDSAMWEISYERIDHRHMLFYIDGFKIKFFCYANSEFCWFWYQLIGQHTLLAIKDFMCDLLERNVCEVEVCDTFMKVLYEPITDFKSGNLIQQNIFCFDRLGEIVEGKHKYYILL